MKISLKAVESKWFLAILSFILGAVLILAIRFFTYQPPDQIHYHANFAVYMNGQREQFKAPTYYEEESAASCSTQTAAEDTPMSRVHMHGNVNDVVHVEDSRVTWGNFFTVLGWNIGPSYLASRDNIYQANDTDKITFLLNGKKVDDITNTIIGDQDKLLVNYGSQSADEINQEYGQIQNKALAADQSKDPLTCGGGEHGATMGDRMRHMF